MDNNANNTNVADKMHHEHIAEHTAKFIVEHARNFLVGAAVVVGVVFILVLFNVYREGKEETASLSFESGLGSYSRVHVAKSTTEASKVLNESITHFANAARIAPGSTVAIRSMFYTGSAYYYLREYESSVEYFQKVAKKRSSPLAPMALLHIVWAYTEMGRFEDVIVEAKKFNRLFGSSYLAGEVAITLSRAYAKVGDVELARKTLNEFIAKDPEGAFADKAKQRLLLMDSGVF